MDINIENKSLDLEINLSKLYPELEGLEVTPMSIEQNFKSSKYGYDNVKVKAVASDNLEITPTLEEQEYVGLYGTVNVEPATEVYNNAYQEGKNSVMLVEKYLKSIRFYGFNHFETKEVTLNFEKANDFSNMFNTSLSGSDSIYMEKNTTVEHITISTKALVRNMYRMFYCDNLAVDDTLKRITLNFDTDTDYQLNINNAFWNMRRLEIVDGTPLNLSGCNSINSPFQRCENLKEIRFSVITKSLNISQSSLLSDESVNSIINALVDLTDGEAQTVTFHGDVKAKLTDEQIASITAKNWTLA